LTIQNLKIKYHVEMIKPELKVTPKKILFPVLPVGEKASLIVLIQNQTKEDYVCQWLTPPFCVSGLTIMPQVFDIKASSYNTCVIEYIADFRPYGPFSFEQVEAEIKEKYDTIELYNNNSNPALEDKVKKEVEGVLALTQDDKKKKDLKPGDKKKTPDVSIKKTPDVKKTKQQLEEDEKKRKEMEEIKQKEDEERVAKRVQEFDRTKELKLLGAEYLAFDESHEDMGKSEHLKFTIPLFFKNEKGMKKTFLEVNSCCIEQLLKFEKDELNFGEVSVKTRKLMTITLTNNLNKSVDIKMKPLIISNCFSAVNAVREIASGGSLSFTIEFFPLKDFPYLDEFTVHTNETQATIKLRGKGVSPEVSINTDRVMFMGNCVATNTLEKTFEITNLSAFNINYEIKILKTGKKNKNGAKPFCFSPYKGEIGANGKVPIKVTFFGDHQDYENFYELVLIDVPNQKKPNYIFVTAACWNRQVYWKEFSTPVFPENAETLVADGRVQEYFIDPLKVKPIYANDRIVLVFPKKSDNHELMTKRKLTIGNCKLNDPKNEKSGNYEIIIPKEDVYFTCDNSKATLNAGLENTVTFCFKKPEKDPMLKDIECLNEIGMWITTRAELKITGGYVPQGQQDVTIIEIFLKAYIEQL
jgi:hypothetical protein